MTKHMEGDKHTGCMVIPQYFQLLNDLEDRLDNLDFHDALHSMISEMLRKTKGYLEEALHCETLVMSTILNPCFRLCFFSKNFGKTSTAFIEAEATLLKIFGIYQRSIPPPQALTNETDVVKAGRVCGSQIFHNFSDDDSDEIEGDQQLQDYLQAIIKMKGPDYDVSDPEAALLWWRVR